MVLTEIKNRKYVGNGERRYEALEGAHAKKEPYIAEKELREAVNLALFLRRPLLLEGDPGCGKTRLAYAVAYELGFPLKTCYIRSTSRAADLLYEYDHLQRLYEIQEGKECWEDGKPPKRSKYLKLKELGKAVESAEKGVPSVVLIDEIDKADIDFPNDLLLVLDEWKFQIDELDPDDADPENGRKHAYDALQDAPWDERKDSLPLVVVTSNQEKELPAPFLRRCIYHYIEFPKADTLEKIAEAHFPEKITPIFQAAVAKFMELRAADIRWRKRPSTSELIEWLKVLENDNDMTDEDLNARELWDLPSLGVLVKTRSDHKAVKALKGSA